MRSSTMLGGMMLLAMTQFASAQESPSVYLSGDAPSYQQAAGNPLEIIDRTSSGGEQVSPYPASPSVSSSRTLPQRPARLEPPPDIGPLSPEPPSMASEFVPTSIGAPDPPRSASPPEPIQRAVYEQDARPAEEPLADPPLGAEPSSPQVAEPAGSVALGPPADEPRLTLSPREGAEDSKHESLGTLNSALTMISGLGVVLAIFLLIAWGVRRANPKAMGVLPSQVVEVLGRAPLAGRQQVYMIRCGAKLVLVSVTPDGAEPLTEITDPFEVDRLAGLCEQSRPGSSTATFRRVMNQYARQGGAAHVG